MSFRKLFVFVVISGEKAAGESNDVTMQCFSVLLGSEMDSQLGV